MTHVHEHTHSVRIFALCCVLKPYGAAVEPAVTGLMLRAWHAALHTACLCMLRCMVLPRFVGTIQRSRMVTAQILR
jgi:hypothetical protein